MSGGTISGNTGFYGGGVAVRGSDTDGSSTFTMSAGTISDNVRGVYVGYNSTFNMSGTAVISGNTSTSSGGGVYVSGIDSNYFDTSKAGKFNMSGGTISGNTAYDSTYDVSGGGVLVTGGGSFTMTNGTISGNTANDRGGGVYVVSRRPTNPTQSNPSYTSTFTKTGGTIYGNSGDANANTANRTSGAKGHAAYYYMATDATTTDLYRDTTLGVGDNINTTDTVTGWNQ
jgi:predicted outer membrane repeat protein